MLYPGLKSLMEILDHQINGQKISEVKSDKVVISSVQDALDLMVSKGITRKIILYKGNFPPEFFDLSSRLAGEILQKFVNYNVQIALVGDYSDASPSLRAFIIESNRGNQIGFFAGLESAKNFLIK